MAGEAYRLDGVLALEVRRGRSPLSLSSCQRTSRRLSLRCRRRFQVSGLVECLQV